MLESELMRMENTHEERKLRGFTSSNILSNECDCILVKYRVIKIDSGN